MQRPCSKCGKIHEDWPALGFKSPDSYHALTQEEKDKLAALSSDFCTITYPDQTDRFIRCVLFQIVIGHPEPLAYGVWVSLSEKSFNDYKSHFNDNEYKATYFGYLCNSIAEYDSTLSIKTNVELRGDGNRPIIIPHRSQIDHPFVKDYYGGINIEEAENRIHTLMDSQQTSS